MRSLAALAVLLVALPAAAQPQSRWTFCVASAAGADQIFMSAVFVAAAPRARLESAFAATVARLGAAGATALCPNPRPDKDVVLDALSNAEKVDRERGATLRAVAASDFPAADPVSPRSAEKAVAEKAVAPKARPDERRG